MSCIRASRLCHSYRPGEGSGFSAPQPIRCWFCSRPVERRMTSARSTAAGGLARGRLESVCVTPSSSVPCCNCQVQPSSKAMPVDRTGVEAAANQAATTLHSDNTATVVSHRPGRRATAAAAAPRARRGLRAGCSRLGPATRPILPWISAGTAVDEPEHRPVCLPRRGSDHRAAPRHTSVAQPELAPSRPEPAGSGRSPTRCIPTYPWCEAGGRRRPTRPRR